jgi:hypothetical protein
MTGQPTSEACYFCGRPLKKEDETLSLWVKQHGGPDKVVRAHKECAERKN